MTPEFQGDGFSQLVLYEDQNSGGIAFAYDELRVGGTFADIRVGQ